MPDFDPWTDIGHRALRILFIWLLASLLLRFLRSVCRRFDQLHHMWRVETQANSFRHTANVVIVGLTLLLTLSEFGISITPILATAGVAGVALGFGAHFS